MSQEYIQIDQDTLDLYKDDIEGLLKLVFGSDLDVSYSEDGTVDLNVVGGDLNLTGTAFGNGINDLYALVKNRVAIRLLTYYSETPLLPNGYGSYLTDLIGISVIDDETFQSDDNVIKMEDIRGFVDGLVRFSLEFEPLVTQVNEIDTVYEDGSLYIKINFNSIFLNYINTNLQLIGE